MGSHDLIKGRIDYHALLRTLGIEFIDREGEGALYFRCLNPQHEDTDPSMKVHYRTRGNATQGLWRCWNGACRIWRGDVIDLVRVMRRQTYAEAVAWLTAFVGGIASKDILVAVAQEEIRARSAAMESDRPEMPFPCFLPEPNVPMEPDHGYFRVVRDPPVNGENARADGCVHVVGGEYGGYMAVPIRWMDGTVVTFQAIAVDPDAVARRLRWAAEHHTVKAARAKLYPPEAPTDRLVYGAHRVRPGGIVGLVEGVLDDWRLWDALPGVQGCATLSNRVTKVQAAILLGLYPSEIVLFPDNDPNEKGFRPGDQLVLDAVEALAYAVPVSVATLPEGEDPDSAGEDALRKAFAERVGFGSWVLRWGTAPRESVSLRDVLDREPGVG